MSFSAGASGTQKTPAISPCQKFVGHSLWVRGVIHLLGGRRIMTCSDDRSLRVWNLKTGEQIGDPWWVEESSVSAIALSLDGKKVVCGCADGAMKLWDVDTGKFIAKWTGHTSQVRSVCWNRDYGRVVSASRDGTARVWDVESGKTVLPIDTGLSDLQAVVCSPDMAMIATGGDDSSDLKEFIKIWDAKTGKLVTNLKGHTQRVYCLAWTANGSTLVSGSRDYSIRTWNTTTWQQIHVLTGHTSIVYGIAISPNGRILASASWDHTARLWNLENGLPIGSPLQHPDIVQCVSFSTDGKSLATGCWNNNAYSWDISGILQGAGVLIDRNKPLIDADTTRRPGHRCRDVHRIPPKFFNDAPHHPHASTTHHPSRSSARWNNIIWHPSLRNEGLMQDQLMSPDDNFDIQPSPPDNPINPQSINPLATHSRKRRRSSSGESQRKPTSRFSEDSLDSPSLPSPVELGLLPPALVTLNGVSSLIDTWKARNVLSFTIDDWAILSEQLISAIAAPIAQLDLGSDDDHSRAFHQIRDAFHDQFPTSAITDRADDNVDMTLSQPLQVSPPSCTSTDDILHLLRKMESEVHSRLSRLEKKVSDTSRSNC